MKKLYALMLLTLGMTVTTVAFAAEEPAPALPAAETPAAAAVPAAEPPAPAAVAGAAAATTDAAATAPAPAEPPAPPASPEAQKAMDEMRNEWTNIQNDYLKDSRAALKRGLAQLPERLSSGQALEAAVGESLKALPGQRDSLAQSTQALIKQAEDKKNPQFAATLANELALKQSVMGEIEQSLLKDRDDTGEALKQIAAWQAEEAALVKTGDELDAAVVKGLADVKAGGEAAASDEWNDAMNERVADIEQRTASFKEQVDRLSENLSDWTELYELANSHVIRYKETAGDWQNLVERRTKEAGELFKS